MRLKPVLHQIVNSLRSRETQSDAKAIGSSLGLLLFLVSLKIYLAWWFIVVGQGRPDIRIWQIPLLVGGDVAVCACAAILYYLLRQLGSASPGMLKIPLGRFAPFLLHFAIVLFSVVSWKVFLIYNTPLSIDLIRAAGNLSDMRDSIAAYVSVIPIAFLAAGLLSYFAVRRPFSRFLLRVPSLAIRWRLWVLLFISSAVIVIPWFFFCRGAFDYGLKRNAILHFIQYYSTLPEPVDMESLLRELTAAVKKRDPEIRASESLITPGLRLPSELSVTRRKAAGMNVVLIVMESTSAQYVDRETTPNLFRLADTGIRFSEYFTTTTMTNQALYSVLYSDYLPDLRQSLRKLYKRPLPQPSIATVLSKAGYHTALFQSGDLDFMDTHYLADGFDVQMGASQITDKKWAWSWGAYEEQTVASLSRWLAEHKTRKFFALYSTIFPHHPYFSPNGLTPFGTETMADKYRNSLQYADRCIGTLIDFLEKEGLREKTVIVVTGDHGETVSSLFRFGHGIALTPEEMRVPFIISNPILFKKPMMSRLEANHLDIGPTILGVLGLPSPKDWLGRNLADEEVPSRQLVVHIQQSKIVGVIDRNVVYSYDEKSGIKRFYRLIGNDMKEFGGDSELSGKFLDRIILTDRWAVWRHLDRALSTSHVK